MVVTRLEELDKSKVKVYLNDAYAFMLYQKELVQYGIEAGAELTQETYARILTEVIYKRALKKVLEILKFMDRTEQELRRKLSDAGYPEEIIEKAIHYVKEYGYLNDRRFASAYVRARMHRKSKMVIKTELKQKGISKEIIDQVFKEEYVNDEFNEAEDAELIAIKRNVAKRTKSPENLTPDEKKKLIASLYRKGFNIDKIKRVIC